MLHFKSFLFTLLILLFVNDNAISQSINDELKVELKNNAENFFNAYQNYNGEKVLNLVSQSSIDKHYEYRDYALYATYEELTEMDMFDIIMTLSFRALFSKNEIINIGKEEFFLLQYNKEKRIGEGGRPSDKIQFEDFKKTNSNSISANAKDLTSGKSSPIFFVKENGKWKIDLVKDYEFKRQHYNKQLPDGIDKKELIRATVNQLEGANEKLLEPLVN